MHAAVDLVFGQFLEPQTERDVVIDVQMREERVALKYGVHLPRVGRHIGDIFPLKEDGAFIGRLEAADEAQGRGFAATGRTQQGDKFFVSNEKVKVF